MLELEGSFKKEVKGLKDYILLVTVEAKSYQNAVNHVLKFLVAEQGIPGVYVTLNKPCDIIRRTLEMNSIDPRVIIFIDATGGTDKTRKSEQCLHIGTPEKLSDLSVAMDQAIKALPGTDKFLVFDSINTLAIFNKPATVARFIHFLAGKIREWKVQGVIVTLGKETEQSLLDELLQFSDARVDIGGEV